MASIPSSVPTILRVTPTSGSTITMPNTDGDLTIIIAPATDLAALTIGWSPTPLNGQRVNLLFTKAITTITHTGAVLNTNFSSMVAAGDASFQFDVTGNLYMCTGMNIGSRVASLSFTCTTAGGTGNAVFYPTDTGLSTGVPLFSSIQSVQPAFDVAAPNNAFAKPVVSGELKSVTINCKTQVFNGVTVLGIAVLGSNTIGNSPNGLTLTVLIHGVLA